MCSSRPEYLCLSSPLPELARPWRKLRKGEGNILLGLLEAKSVAALVFDLCVCSMLSFCNCVCWQTLMYCCLLYLPLFSSFPRDAEGAYLHHFTTVLCELAAPLAIHLFGYFRVRICSSHFFLYRFRCLRVCFTMYVVRV